MKPAERKQRRQSLETVGFTFKYVRGNTEVGGGYAVYHKGRLIAPGREVTLDEAIEWTEKEQNRSTIALRKFLMGGFK